MTSLIKRYTVIGNPIAHSLSPRIHRLFSEQTQRPLHYDTYLAPIGQLPATLRALQMQQTHGANVTLPFKEQAFTLMDRVTERAHQAGAVNTISFLKDHTLIGDNTDGEGLVTDLVENLNIALQGQHIVILGAGGATRGLLWPLLQQQPRLLTIANRTVAKAEHLISQYQSQGHVDACGLEQLHTLKPDLVINATSASRLNGCLDIPRSCIHTTTVCYDINYAAQQTPFLQFCQQQGANACFDGIGMLVEQAALSFYQWHHIKPETAGVIHLLKQADCF